MIKTRSKEDGKESLREMIWISIVLEKYWLHGLIKSPEEIHRATQRPLGGRLGEMPYA